MTAGAVEEVDEEVNEGVDEKSMFDHQGQYEVHQQGERESTNTKSTKKKLYIENYATPDRPRPAAIMLQCSCFTVLLFYCFPNLLLYCYNGYYCT